MHPIFFLALDPSEAVKFALDIHIRSACGESAHLLYTVFHSLLPDHKWKEECPKRQNGEIFTSGYIHSPISKWARQTKSNFLYALKYAVFVLDEFKFRFGKDHAVRKHLTWIVDNQELVLALIPQEAKFEIKTSCVVAKEELPEGCTAIPMCLGSFRVSEKKNVGKLVQSYREWYGWKCEKWMEEGRFGFVGLYLFFWHNSFFYQVKYTKRKTPVWFVTKLEELRRLYPTKKRKNSPTQGDKKEKKRIKRIKK